MCTEKSLKWSISSDYRAQEMVLGNWPRPITFAVYLTVMVTIQTTSICAGLRAAGDRRDTPVQLRIGSS